MVIYLVIGLVVGYLIGRHRGQVAGSRGQGESNALNEQRAREHREQLDKIMEYLNSHDQVTNDEVEKMLGVSNTSAERYLDELEKQGKLRQVGRVGRSVTYKRS